MARDMYNEWSCVTSGTSGHTRIAKCYLLRNAWYPDWKRHDSYRPSYGHTGILWCKKQVFGSWESPSLVYQMPDVVAACSMPTYYTLIAPNALQIP